MREISFFEKIKFLTKSIYDLRNTDLTQLKDLTDVMNIIKSKNPDTKISMNSDDLLKLMLNTERSLMLEGCDKGFYIDQKSLCKLMMEINDFKNNLVSEARKDLVAKAETAYTEDMTLEQQNDSLKSQLMLLEEEIHTLRIQKTIIVPTDNLYRTKREYDSLRKQANAAVAERHETIAKLWDIKCMIRDLQANITELETKLKRNDISNL